MKLYVVGIGPGRKDQMTFRAREALKESSVIIGYTVYVDLLREDFKDKQLITTPMKKEVERCNIAIQKVLCGNTVSMVCSGDAGIYAMAGLIYEVAQQYEPINIEVIPGITAACSGAAILGAPLSHDFAVISLSDLLTPWEQIEKRLSLASKADFLLCLYNPCSKKRYDYLKKACDIVMQYKKESTVAGFVKNIGRIDESYTVTTLKELRNISVDMFTTVYIGNSNTKNLDGKMITPRGYKNV